MTPKDPRLAYRQLPTPKAICVDVDGTLITDGRLNTGLIDYLRGRKAEGYELTLWSMRGASYARCVATDYLLYDLFDHIISKPGIVIDDRGTDWMRRAIVIRDVVGLVAEPFRYVISDGRAAELEAENDRLRRALEWYADAENYLETGWQGDRERADVTEDNGERAKRALRQPATAACPQYGV